MDVPPAEANPSLVRRVRHAGIDTGDRVASGFEVDAATHSAERACRQPMSHGRSGMGGTREKDKEPAEACRMLIIRYVSMPASYGWIVSEEGRGCKGFSFLIDINARFCYKRTCTLRLR